MGWVWAGVVWCGRAWCGMVGRGALRCDAWCGVTCREPYGMWCVACGVAPDAPE